MAKVRFELADDFTHVERTLANNQLVTVEAGGSYETDDLHEIAELDQTYGLQRAKKPGRGGDS